MKKNKLIICILLFITVSCKLSQDESDINENSQSLSEKTIEKPTYVIIVGQEIITEERLNKLAENGYVKSMNKGVSEEQRNEFFKKFGDVIQDKEFIITIELYSHEEVVEREKTKHDFIVEDINFENDETLEIKLGDNAKDFVVEMIDGKNIRLSNLKGNVVLLNFWATWCGPCLMEFHEFPDKIIKPNRNEKFYLLPISRGETEEKVKLKMQELKQKRIDFNVGIDPHQSIAGLYNARNSIPKNILIDKKGKIRYISNGYSEENMKNISDMIKKLLKEN